MYLFRWDLDTIGLLRPPSGMAVNNAIKIKMMDSYLRKITYHKGKPINFSLTEHENTELNLFLLEFIGNGCSPLPQRGLN